MAAQMEYSSEDLLARILSSLDDDKAEDAEPDENDEPDKAVVVVVVVVIMGKA